MQMIHFFITLKLMIMKVACYTMHYYGIGLDDVKRSKYLQVVDHLLNKSVNTDNTGEWHTAYTATTAWHWVVPGPGPGHTSHHHTWPNWCPTDLMTITKDNIVHNGDI